MFSEEFSVLYGWTVMYTIWIDWVDGNCWIQQRQFGYEVVMYFWKLVNGRRSHSSQQSRKTVVYENLELERPRSLH